ncbi:ATP-dependent zinc protease family protein [Marinobacter psychrophilus]|jgi:hypothetical protein|nr:RimK/LysX family protein [Marinobacter psychrophilus]
MGFKGFMGSKPNGSVPLALPLLVILTGLAGCSADQYFMVPKSNLETVNASVQNQRATLVTMENNAKVRFEQTIDDQTASTEIILQAISAQVKAPECPPVPKRQACPAATAAKAVASQLKGKLIVGEVEKLFLTAAETVYDARVDSGAETSSIDARNIVRFERDGSNWVRFDVPVPGSEGLLTLEKEISRRVKILQSNVDDPERRVVVELQFVIGNHTQVAEFTLTDRSHLTHQVLIGRNVLRDVMLIDVGKEFATELPDTMINGNSSYRDAIRDTL